MAITRFDAQMLQEAIQNTGSEALKRKALQQQHEQEMSRLAIESQLRDIQQKRYEAQAAHFQNMEDVGQGRNAILAQSEADRTKIAEQGKSAVEDYKNAVASMNDWVQTIRKARLENLSDPTKGHTQQDCTDIFNEAIKGLPPQIHDKMMQSPMYAGLSTGKVDFSTVPSAADLAGKVAPNAAKPPPDTNEQNTYDELGHVINRTVTHNFPPPPDNPIGYTPPAPAGAGAAAPDASAIQQQVGLTPAVQGVSDMVRVQHPNGQTGMIPKANLQAALQAGYKLAPGAPSAAVPGVGSAQDDTLTQ